LRSQRRKRHRSVMPDPPLDHEEVVLALGILGDIRFNLERIVTLLEEANGEEEAED
jgi:hypothetical protein